MSIADRADLAPIVAGWLHEAFWIWDGCSYEQVVSWVVGATAQSGPPQCFVLLHEGEPIGTASLAAEDLDERPHLTPWLAGVFVEPAFRGRGYALGLIRRVEDACRQAGTPALWLYTSTAQHIYARAGWAVAETVERAGKPAVVVMRRDLPP